MPKLAANLVMLFTEQPFMGRFAAAKKAGFRYVEYLFPYGYSAEELKQQLADNGLEQVLFNLPAGDWQAGDRGIAAAADRVEEFRQGVDSAIGYAQVLNVPRVNCLAGKVSGDTSRADAWGVLVDNLKYAAAKFAENNLTLLVEPINIYDIPSFFLNNTKDALRLLEDVGAENLRIQYDIYHMQRMEGELTATIRKNLDKIGHIQIADNPGRHQPGTGEIDYRYLLPELDRMGYEGFVGMEYVPEPDTVSSLNWIEDHGLSL